MTDCPEIEEDDEDAPMVSDCCGVEMGDLLDLEICPACREHCQPVREGQL